MTMPALVSLVKADFLERTRRYSFLVTLILTLYAGYAFVPGPQAKYLTLALGPHRGLYNSAWIGSMVAILASTFLGLVGFYLVKGSLERDRRTGVGQMLASTPLGKFRYLASKALSNLSVLLVIVAALIVMAVIMQYTRGEARSIDVAALLSPFVLSSLPVLVVVAAMAIFFESVPFLRSAFGNVIYYALWTVSLILSLQDRVSTQSFSAFYDLTGTGPIVRDMQKAALQFFPDYKGELNIGIQFIDAPRQMHTFVWNGVDWTVELVMARFSLVLLSLGLIALAAIFFDRFDHHATSRRGRYSSAPPEELRTVAAPATAQTDSFHLSRLAQRGDSIRFGGMVIGELKLMAKGTSRWWFLIAIGLVIAEVFSPFEVAREWLLPISFLLPLIIWSQMGTREKDHGTEQMIFSIPHPLARQLPALWVSGIAIAVACGLGLGLKSIFLGEWTFLLSWIVGSLFVPSLALAFGTLSGSRRLFESVYPMLWYLGPMNHNPYLDFVGATQDSSTLGVPLYIGLISAGLLLVALVARRRQMAK